MAENTAGEPVKTENDPAVVTPAKGEATLLTGTQTPTPSSTGEGNSQLPHTWMAGLTAEQKADETVVKSLEKFQKGIPDLAKSYIELETKLTSAVFVPSSEATEEEKERYRKAIGVPEKSEDYALEAVTLPDGATVDEQMQGEYLGVAHEIGLTPQQANAIHKWYMDTIGPQLVEASKIVKTSTEEATRAMQERHAKDPDSQTYMERGFAAVGSAELVALYTSSGLGNHPEIVDMHIKIGKLVGDHKFVDGQRGATLESSPVGQRSHQEIAAVVYPKTEAS